MQQELESRLINQGIKPTAMRLLVLKEIIESKKAINFNELELRFDQVDRSTLYRTLNIFEDKHLIHPISDGTSSVKYAICKSNCNCKPDELHVHFYCTNCESTYCLHDTPIPSVEINNSYKIDTTLYLLKGTCPMCQ